MRSVMPVESGSPFLGSHPSLTMTAPLFVGFFAILTRCGGLSLRLKGWKTTLRSLFPSSRMFGITLPL